MANPIRLGELFNNGYLFADSIYFIRHFTADKTSSYDNHPLALLKFEYHLIEIFFVLG